MAARLHARCPRVVGAGPCCTWTSFARVPRLGARDRGNCAWNQGDNGAAERLAHAGADLSLTEGFDFAAGMALYTLMLVGMERALSRTRSSGEEAIGHFRRSGSDGFLSQRSSMRGSACPWPETESEPPNCARKALCLSRNREHLGACRRTE